MTDKNKNKDLLLTTIGVKLRGWTVPNYVLSESKPHGMRECLSYHVSEIPETTLLELCDQFRDAVLEKARQGRS